MMNFVGVALHAAELMEIHDKQGQGILMRFAKLYTPEKMGKIIETAKKFPWWQKYPTAAFMKSVGIVNKQEKECLTTKTELPITG